MRSPCLALAAVLSAGATHAANADPLLECAVMVGQTADLNACLSAQLEVSYGAMNEALALARARAQALDSGAGGDAAILGIEASQQAFEAWRDTACQTEAIFAGGDAAADNVELACEIALTRTRSDMLVRLSAPRAG